MENNIKENNETFRKKYEELHFKTKFMEVNYQELYEKMYDDYYNKIIKNIYNVSNIYLYNNFIYDYKVLKPYDKKKLYMILYSIIFSISTKFDKNAFIDFIFENEEINVNYIYTYEILNKKSDEDYSLLMLSIKYDNMHLFNKLMTYEHIDYNYNFKIDNYINCSILSEAIKIYNINNYYFEQLINYKDLYTKIQENNSLINLFINIKEDINILNKLLFHKDFVYKNDYIYMLSYINENDSIYDIFKNLYEKHKDFIKNSIENNVYEAIFKLNLIQNNFKTIDYIIDFINDKEIMKIILKQNEINIQSLYVNLIEKKNTLKKNINLYEEFKKLITKIEEICETKISDKIVCKNHYTCNICLDESNENNVYNKCTTCNVIFHKDCLFDYFESCNTKKCCYCQNETNFVYLLE